MEQVRVYIKLNITFWSMKQMYQALGQLNRIEGQSTTFLHGNEPHDLLFDH